VSKFNSCAPSSAARSRGVVKHDVSASTANGAGSHSCAGHEAESSGHGHSRLWRQLHYASWSATAYVSGDKPNEHACMIALIMIVFGDDVDAGHCGAMRTMSSYGGNFHNMKTYSNFLGCRPNASLGLTQVQALFNSLSQKGQSALSARCH
jgi:hypothetical protein